MRSVSRILAATDFSPASQAALARAGQLAARHSAELHIVHATPDRDLFLQGAPTLREHYEAISKKAGLLLQQTIDKLTAEFAIRVIGDVHCGKASQVITGATGMYQPHLLIIGAHGERGAQLSPLALGTTTLKLINQVKVPLLLVRQAAGQHYDTSLAAVDSSIELARRVVHWACLLTGAGNCHIVRAYEVPYLERLKLCGASAETLALCSRDAELAASYAADPPWSAEDTAAKVHMHLVRGSPLPSVLREISRHHPQVVAIGRHERVPFETEHPLIGCVGMQIASQCPVDVLIVP